MEKFWRSASPSTLDSNSGRGQTIVLYPWSGWTSTEEQKRLDHGQLHEVDDFWTVDARSEPRVLDEEWTGRSVFQIVHRQAPLGKQWQAGRLTVIQPTTRPPKIWDEVWRRLTFKCQQDAIDVWKIEGPRRQAEYTAANKIQMVPTSAFRKYDQLLAEDRNSLSLPAVPAMACLTKAQVNANFSGNT